MLESLVGFFYPRPLRVLSSPAPSIRLPVRPYDMQESYLLFQIIAEFIQSSLNLSVKCYLFDCIFIFHFLEELG